jgi:hypothetical protein
MFPLVETFKVQVLKAPSLEKRLALFRAAMSEVQTYAEAQALIDAMDIVPPLRLYTAV